MRIRLIALMALAGLLQADDLGQRRVAPGAPDVYLNFAFHGQDGLDPGVSSRAVLRAARFLHKHRLRADVYVTEPLARAWADKSPGTIEELRRLGMGFGYHHRPPNPMSFDSPGRRRMMSLAPPDAYRELERYESERLDPATGFAIAGSPGGYIGATVLLKGAPVVLGNASAPPESTTVSPLTGLSDEPPFRRRRNAGGPPAAPPHLVAFDREILRRMGAKMAVALPGQGRPDYPLMWRQGLLDRPSDVSVVNAALAQQPAPAKSLARQVAASPRGRITYVTCLIDHDNRWEDLAAFAADETRIRVVTASDLLAMVRPDDLERIYDRAVVDAAAKIVATASGKLPEFVALAGDALSLSDCVQAFSQALDSRPALAVRVILGPARRSGPAAAVTVARNDVIAAARVLASRLEPLRMPDLLPATVEAAGREMAIESYLYAAASALSNGNDPIQVPALAQVGPDPAQWTIKPARRRDHN